MFHALASVVEVYSIFDRNSISFFTFHGLKRRSTQFFLNFAIYFFCNLIPLNLCIKTIHFRCNLKTRFSLKCFVYTLQPCNTNKCPVWSDWSSWSVCSVTCGGGNRFQNRKCVLPDGTSAQGLFCPGESQHVEKCNENKCPGLALVFYN